MRRLRNFVIPVGLAYVVMQYGGRTWGSTRRERRRALPGDGIVSNPHFVTNHAVTIDAPPEDVWPWLIQMGWHQGGFYTSPRVDRVLFPANWPAADHIIEDLQDRKVGDFVPDGPPESECGYVIRSLEPNRHLVLHSTTHLPLQWRRERGAWVDWTWTFVLDDLGAGRTRLLFRCRGKAGPPWLLVSYLALIVPADFVMSKQMMRGIKMRAERLALGLAGTAEPTVLHPAETATPI